MPSKEYGPTIAGTIWPNDYKTTAAHPAFKTSNKYHLKVDEAFLKHLVQALRTEGAEPRIAVAVWENAEEGKNTLYVKLEAVAGTPQDTPQPEPQPEPEPEPASSFPPEIHDDIPF